ncbi:MAG: hypothetical protein IT380_13280 [Myxococcales bacterium]|nr:hypothetical protein [Myxococcales bacterium]
MESHLKPVSSELDVPTSLTFQPTWLGFPTTAPLKILSRSRLSHALPVSAQAPFFVDSDTLFVGGGQEAQLLVRFAPAVPGPARDVLHVGDVDVRLDAEAFAPPACASPHPCRASAFNPSTGACEEATLPDGTACTGDVCLESASCYRGECVGAARACDDGNACTRDSCAAGLGCQHEDTSADCPTSGDSCLAPVCDSARGCLTAPVADGTPCGDVTCTLANVCLQGRCVALAPPDGFTCAPASPCQGAGTCRAQQCVRPPEQTLSPAWTYAPQDRLVLFDGVADGQGNLYWVECLQGEALACHAVSFTGSGLKRFEGGAVTGMATTLVAQLFDEGRFVFLTGSGQLTALGGVDGRTLWSVNLKAALDPEPDATDLATVELVSDGRGHLWVASVPNILRCGDSEGAVSLALVDAATGALTRSMLHAASGSMLADETGAVYAATGPGSVGSWDSAGQSRFSAKPGTTWGLTAAYGGEVVTASNGRLSAQGAVLAPFSPVGLMWDFGVVASGGRTVRLRRPELPIGTPPVPVYLSAELALFHARAAQGTSLGPPVAGPDGEVTAPFLAKDDTVVLVGRPRGPTARLQGVTLDGRPRFSCALEEPWTGSAYAIAPHAAFTGTRFGLVHQPLCPGCVTDPPKVLRVFDVGPLGLASHGWVGPRGTEGRAGRPR